MNLYTLRGLYEHLTPRYIQVSKFFSLFSKYQNALIFIKDFKKKIKKIRNKYAKKNSSWLSFGLTGRPTKTQYKQMMKRREDVLNKLYQGRDILVFNLYMRARLIRYADMFRIQNLKQRQAKIATKFAIINTHDIPFNQKKIKRKHLNEQLPDPDEIINVYYKRPQQIMILKKELESLKTQIPKTIRKYEIFAILEYNMRIIFYEKTNKESYSQNKPARIFRRKYYSRDFHRFSPDPYSDRVTQHTRDMSIREGSMPW